MDGEISLKEISHQRIFLPAVTAAAVTVALVTLVVLLRRKRGRRPSPVVATETAAGARDARSQMVTWKELAMLTMCNETVEHDWTVTSQEERDPPRPAPATSELVVGK